MHCVEDEARLPSLPFLVAGLRRSLVSTHEHLLGVRGRALLKRLQEASKEHAGHIDKRRQPEKAQEILIELFPFLSRARARRGRDAQCKEPSEHGKTSE